MSSALSFLTILGSTAAIGLAVSPFPTIKAIWTNKSIGEFSAFPYIVTFCQATLWITYSIITPGKLGLIPVNVIISLLELSYVIVFLVYTSKRSRQELVVTISYVFGATLGAILISFLTTSPSGFVGFFAVISNIVMYAAPLGVVKTVIETKSVEFMPFLLSLAGTVSALIWTLWAVVARDSFVFIPNILGVILGIIQLAVYNKFRNETPSRISPDAVMLATLESGSDAMTPPKQLR
jgi:solute carrier family 50 protein (sugar transporter)